MYSCESIKCEESVENVENIVDNVENNDENVQVDSGQNNVMQASFESNLHQNETQNCLQYNPMLNQVPVGYANPNMNLMVGSYPPGSNYLINGQLVNNNMPNVMYQDGIPYQTVVGGNPMYQQFAPNMYQQLSAVNNMQYQQIPPNMYQNVTPNSMYQQVGPNMYQQIPPSMYQQATPNNMFQTQSVYQQVGPDTYQLVTPNMQHTPMYMYQPNVFNNPYAGQVPVCVDANGQIVSAATLVAPPHAALEVTPPQGVATHNLITSPTVNTNCVDTSIMTPSPNINSNIAEANNFVPTNNLGPTSNINIDVNNFVASPAINSNNISPYNVGVTVNNSNLSPYNVGANSAETNNFVSNPNVNMLPPGHPNNAVKKSKKVIYRNPYRTLLPADSVAQRNTESLLVAIDSPPPLKKPKKNPNCVNYPNKPVRLLLAAKRKNRELGPDIICMGCKATYGNDEAAFLQHTCVKRKEKRNYCNLCFKIFITVEEYAKHICQTPDGWYHCNFCNESYSSVDIYSQHTQTHAKNPIYNCVLCSVSFPSHSLYQSHMDSHMEVKTSVYCCSICSETFESQTLHDQHMVTHNVTPTGSYERRNILVAHGDAVYSTNAMFAQVSASTPLPQTSNCTQDQAVSVEQTSAAQTLSNQNVVQVSVEQVGVQVSENSGLSSVSNSENNGVNSANSSGNSGVNNASSSGNSGVISATNSGVNSASNSGVISATNNGVNSGSGNSVEIDTKMTQIRDNKNDEEQVSISDHQLAQMDAAIDAMVSQYNNYEENLPDPKSTSENSHKADSSSKEAGTKFLCGYCSINITEGKEHVCAKISHSCQYCGKIFRGKDSTRRFERHLEYHPTELTFECNICPLKFRTTRQLRFHLKNHEKEHRRCHMCNIAFESVEALEEHEKKHKHASFVCQTCNAKFTYERTLNRHLKDIHKLV